jgi:hypothetical protein
MVTFANHADDPNVCVLLFEVVHWYDIFHMSSNFY